MVKTRIALTVALVAALATPALAQSEWIVDSGRYVAGQVPTYPSYAPIGGSSLREGRNAATSGSLATHNQSIWGRTSWGQGFAN